MQKTIVALIALFVGSSAFAGWPEGNYRIPSGTIFYSNGLGAYCGYASMADYERMAKSPYVNIGYLPYGIAYDGICLGSGN